MDKQLTPSEVLREKVRTLLRRGGLRRLAVSAGATVACTLLLFGLLFGVAIVHGDSMNPSFRNSDFVLFSRLKRYGAGGYRPGDVVILRAQAAGLRKYVKRVVGIPGDQVDIGAAGEVLVNGEALGEPYAIGATLREDGAVYPLPLGEGEYFVLGDNRENSSDSRSFGPVAAGQIDGKVLAVLRVKKP
ncbi:MAG: signal peptidase I [Oscillospiraceae bacterium]|jgi:signal peptidase I|nr:signal peptidase I [Oscillospiraceae bacterium]